MAYQTTNCCNGDMNYKQVALSTLAFAANRPSVGVPFSLTVSVVFRHCSFCLSLVNVHEDLQSRRNGDSLNRRTFLYSIAQQPPTIILSVAFDPQRLALDYLLLTFGPKVGCCLWPILSYPECGLDHRDSSNSLDRWLADLGVSHLDNLIN